MIWQDVSHLNSKWKTAWLAGLGSAAMGQTLDENFWWNLQNQINATLETVGRLPIDVSEKPDAATCGALDYLANLVQAGKLPEGQAWFELVVANLDAVKASCDELQQSRPAPQVNPSATHPPIEPAGPTTTVAVSVEACTPQGCDCYVDEGDSGSHMTFFQSELNVALQGAGYQKIDVTGVYDAATCGAVFELGGAFQPAYPDTCNNPEEEWVVPLRCDDMVLPLKKTSKATFGIVALGLVAAGGVGYFVWGR